MACLLQPESNFLHGYFRCQLLVEVVDVEVKITSMQGTHIFQRDRTTQLIKCTPWSTRLCPHPTIIKKMRTFLEVEGKMGSIPKPITGQKRPPQLDTNPNIRKDKAMEKRKRAAPTKRFRPSAAPKPSKTTMCPPVTISKAPINVKPQTDAPENRPPPLENAPVQVSTPWPSAGKMSGNLFKDRNWLLPPNYLNNGSKDTAGITIPKSLIKEEPEVRKQSIISPKAEKCGMEPNCPFCKNQDKEEDWDGNQQNQLQQKTPPQSEIQKAQARCPQTLNYQNPQNSPKLNQETQINRYLSQTKICKQWEVEMKRLNAKYNLDCFSDSELDLESDVGEQYKYDHGYETLI